MCFFHQPVSALSTRGGYYIFACDLLSVGRLHAGNPIVAHDQPTDIGLHDNINPPRDGLMQLAEHGGPLLRSHVTDSRRDQLQIGEDCPACKSVHLILVRAVDGLRRAKAHVSLVDILDQPLKLLIRDIRVELPADFRRESEFAVGESSGAAPSAEQRAGSLADPLFDVTALVDDCSFDPLNLRQFESSEDPGGAGPNYDHIVFFHSRSTLSLIALSMLSTFCFIFFAINVLTIGPINGMLCSKSMTDVNLVPPLAGSNVHTPE